jgi:DNA-binding beta-propeller fold protein YncE
LTARYEMSLFSTAEGPGFRAPEAVSTDFFGNVFVADTGNHRVVQFDPQGRFVFEFGGFGWEVGEFSRPTDVCAREGFRLFVVDAGNERIQEFDIGDSSPEGEVFPFREGSGLESEELVLPTRMDVDAEGRVYISDRLCHCVWIFSPVGELVARLGGLGSQATRFRNPMGVAIGPKGSLYIAESGNRRVQVFDSIGNFVAAWGGAEEDLFVEPAGIDVGPDGNVYVADVGSGLIRVMTPRGVPLFQFGGPGEGPGTFEAPVDVAVGPDGIIYVVDEAREVVERYRMLAASEGDR